MSQDKEKLEGFVCNCRKKINERGYFISTRIAAIEYSAYQSLEQERDEWQAWADKIEKALINITNEIDIIGAGCIGAEYDIDLSDKWQESRAILESYRKFKGGGE